MKKIYLFTSMLAAFIFISTAINAQMISTYIGNGLNTPGGSDGYEHGCSIKPFGIFMDHTGNVFICDYTNSRIRYLSSIDTQVRTIAGSASPGFSGDGGNGTAARDSLPAGIWCNYDGDTAYFCDAGNSAVRMLTKDPVTLSFYYINTIVNTAHTSGFSGDSGLAASAKLSSPQGIFQNQAHDLFIADQGNNRIRKVDHVTGNIYTIAGTGTAGYNGDNIDATTAQLKQPTGIFVDSANNIYIADYGNNRIRKIDAATGKISTVAGNGTAGSTGDNGAAISAELNGPSGVYVLAGSIYIADKSNHKLRVVSPSGTITTMAGTSAGAGYSGDGGAASSAQLNQPSNVYVSNYTSTGYYSGIYISDQGNLRVRKIELANAVHNVANTLQANITPNPTTGQCTIEIPVINSASVDVRIFNAVGTLVYHSQVTTNKSQIDLSAQPEGVYFVHLKSGDANGVQKLVIAH